MAQVVVQDFELEGSPQARPGAAEHPIDKLAPQLTEGGFHLLSYLTEEEPMSGGLIPSNQQHLRLFRQSRGTFGTAIAQITQGDASVYSLGQVQSGDAIIVVPRRQDHMENPPVNVAEQRQLKAKEPSLAGFPEVRPRVSQQAHPPVTDGQAERNRFTVKQVEASCVGPVATGGRQQVAHLGQQVGQPRQPLLVRGQVRKRRLPVLGHQPIGLFERGDFKDALQQGERQHFGITKGGLRVGRPPPLGQDRMGFQEFVHKAVDRNHGVVYALRHRSSASRGRVKGCASILHLRQTDDLAVSTQD